MCLKVRWLRGSSDTVEAMHRSLPVLRLSFLVPTLCLFKPLKIIKADFDLNFIVL